MQTQPIKQTHSVAIKLLMVAAVWIVSSFCIASAQAQGITSGGNSVLSGPRFLPAEQAFNFYTSLPEPSILKLHWAIAPGYYLYKDKFSLSAEVDGKTLLLPLQLPQAIAHNDEFFGDVQVYFEDVVAQVDLQSLPQNAEYTLTLEYQGCAEAGFCYTLQQQEIPLAF